MISINDAEEILKKEYCFDNFYFLINKILIPDFKLEKHDVFFNSPLFSSVREIGFSVKCEVTVFEVILNKGSENKRVTITQEMFKILRNLRINNAVVAFVNNNLRNYRISLLTSRYEYDGDKIVKVLSNPRRYSYSLGFETKTKTPYKFLIARGSVQNLDELIDRFSVEVVNKQFYSEIATCFTELIGGERNGKTYETLLSIQNEKDKNKFAEFGVRLIGRIVFCRFLREKCSENGVPLLPSNLFDIETIKNTKNYYHKVLEPLFFELLNTNQRRRRDEFVTDYYKKIPYLNGGLFSPHMDDHYSYDVVNCCGKANILNIPNSWFVHFYSILNEYNFTVDENTAYDIELSIDPEMLGRIFENLLAEINPETGENAKKSTGSFYTPRDIVDFMVDNSLLSYLKSKTLIDESKLNALISYSKENEDLANFGVEEKQSIINALYNITVLDPACGSGAFPIGMLQKIVYILQELDPNAKLWFEKTTENVDPLFKHEIKNKFDSGSLNYIRKLSVIKNSIFGIDLQPIAVEISRLRCFLSLIIEEKVDDDEPNRGINPLPNLDFKFIIANSLVHLDEDSQMSLFDNEDHINQLKDVKDEYFNTDSERRNELKLVFDNIQKNMLLQNIGSSKNVSKRYYQLSAWKPFFNEPTDWFDADWMFGIKNGFDIVIGNPPYIHFEDMKEISKNLYKPMKYYKSYEARGDIYTLFYEMGLYNLSKHGCLCFITSNKWMRAGYGASLRDNVLQNYQTELLVDLGSGVFESATVDTNIIIIKNKPYKDPTKAVILDHSTSKSNMSDHIKQNFILIKFSKNDPWVILTPIEQSIKDKLTKFGKPLGEWSDIKINRGILTGCNEAFILSESQRAEILNYCSTAEERQRTDAVIRPILRGRDIKQNKCEWAHLYLITLVPSKHYKIEDFPAVSKWLEEASWSSEIPYGCGKIKLMQNGKENTVNGKKFKSRKPTNNKWFETQDSINYMDLFNSQVIAWQRITQGNNFCITQKGMLVLDSMAFLSCGPENINSLFKVLTSQLFYYRMRKNVHEYGESGFRLSNQYIQEFSAPTIQISNDKELYDYYHLTEEEILHINSTK